ncbi:MAG: NCS2 family permease, partial [Phycisphaerae bacterium]
MGLVACLGSGLIELTGAFVAERVRRHTPRAALLSTLAGIALGFISMTFALQIWQRPIVAMLPLGLILITYFSNIRFPLGLPGGLVAVASGTVIAWLLPGDWTGRAMSLTAVSQAWSERGLYLPTFCGGAILEALRRDPAEVLGYLSVIVPMGLFNLVGSLQNIESAEAGGDRFATAPSLAVNGLGSIIAALFGSCFPTTIYIGHPGWKGLGARAGYSILNGLAITALVLTGTVALVNALVPIEAGIAIVLWIGIVITAQAYQATPGKHAPAVAIGLFPAIAAWGATAVAGAFSVSGGTTMQAALESNIATEVNGFLIHGMNLLSAGYIFTCMILAAVSALLIDRKFTTAALWAAIAAVLTLVGLMHAYRIEGDAVAFYFIFDDSPAKGLGFHALRIAVGYALMSAVFLAFGGYQRWRGDVVRAN